MRLFYLERLEEPYYDENRALVVRAGSHVQARRLANHKCRDEGKIWTDSSKVKCSVLKMDGSAGIICTEGLDG